jgi:fluoroquinolone resistance protein
MQQTLSQSQLDAALASRELRGSVLLAGLDWPDASDALRATDCRFVGIDFRGRSLNGARFDACTFVDCSFRSASLAECAFERCHLYEAETDTACDFSFATLTNARFTGCDLTTAVCRRTHAFGIELARCQAAGIDFSGSDFRLGTTAAVAATFTDCNLAYADFTQTLLPGASFAGSRLSHSIWHDADLAAADLSRCQLDNIESRRLNLRGADLRGAAFNQLDPRQIDLTGVRMFADQGLVVLKSLGIEID